MAWLHQQLGQARQLRDLNADLMAQAKGFKRGMDSAQSQCALMGAQLREAQQQVRGKVRVQCSYHSNGFPSSRHGDLGQGSRREA